MVLYFLSPLLSYRWLELILVPIQREVSLQIAQLFKDAPDLRSDFLIFMPPKTQKFLDDESLWPCGIGASVAWRLL